MQDESNYFKMISFLLQFPDEAYFKTLPALHSVVEKMNRDLYRASIVVFLKDIEAYDALQVQEQYTALFDMSPSTTLNMTYHLWGDSEKRARLLTSLQQEYASADLEKSTSELPDYLPLILEYMAIVPHAKRSDVIKKSLQGLDTLFERLKPVAPSYARLLEPLTGMFTPTLQKTEDFRSNVPGVKCVRPFSRAIL